MGIAWSKLRAFFFTRKFQTEGYGSGFGVFSPSDSTPVQTMLPSKLDAAPLLFAASDDGSIVLVQTRTGKLWRLEYSNGEVLSTLFYPDAVMGWWWGANNQLLVQKEDGQYAILNQQGVEVQQLDLTSAIKSIEGMAEAEIVAIDW